jgi:ribosomal protein S18 acetylase RimI-like enzyme
VRGSDTTARSEIAAFDPAEFTARLDQLIAVYAAAIRPPAEQLAGRRPIMVAHASYPGFRALAAVIDGELAGFCYGFHGAVGQWWHDRVNYGLAATHGQAAAKAWLHDSMEIAELHVLPAWQGRGFGSGLLRQVAAGRTERTVVLSTRDTESVARRMYRGVGFTDLLTGFRFDGAEPSYAVMGAELPLRAESPSR